MMSFGPDPLEIVMIFGAGLLAILFVLTMLILGIRLRPIRVIYAFVVPPIVAVLSLVVLFDTVVGGTTERIERPRVIEAQCEEMGPPSSEPGYDPTALLRADDLRDADLPVPLVADEYVVATVSPLGDRWLATYRIGARARPEVVFLSFADRPVGTEERPLDPRDAEAVLVRLHVVHARRGGRLFVSSVPDGAELFDERLRPRARFRDVYGSTFESAIGDGEGGVYVLRRRGDSTSILHLRDDGTHDETPLPRALNASHLSLRGETLCVRGVSGATRYTTGPLAPAAWPLSALVSDRRDSLLALLWTLLVSLAGLLLVAAPLRRAFALRHAREVTVEATADGLVLVDGDDRAPLGEIGAWEGAAEMEEGSSLACVAIGMRRERRPEQAYREPSPPVQVHVDALAEGSLDALRRRARERLIERGGRVGLVLLLAAVPILTVLWLFD